MAKYIEGVWPNYGLAPLRFKKIGVTLRSQYPNWEIDLDLDNDVICYFLN